MTWSQGILNGDGTVNISDLSNVLRNYDKSAGASGCQHQRRVHRTIRHHNPACLCRLPARLAAGGPAVRCCLVLMLPVGVAHADVFNMPNGETSLQFVTVGDPGNAPDTVVMTTTARPATARSLTSTGWASTT